MCTRVLPPHCVTIDHADDLFRGASRSLARVGWWRALEQAWAPASRGRLALQ